MSTHAVTPTPAPVRYIRRHALAARWGCSVMTTYRHERRGTLPPPTRISPGIVGWRSDIIEAIEAERTAVHDDARHMRAGA